MYDPNLLTWLEGKAVTRSDTYLELENGEKELCFLYHINQNAKGYGRRVIDGRQYFVHRLMAAFLLKRPLENGEIVMHKCNHPACFHPRHLQVGTVKDNNAHRAQSGRSYGGKKRRKRLKVEEVIMIKIALKHFHFGIFALSCKYGVGLQTIRDIRDRNTWRDVKIPSKAESIALFKQTAGIVEDNGKKLEGGA